MSGSQGQPAGRGEQSGYPPPTTPMRNVWRPTGLHLPRHPHTGKLNVTWCGQVCLSGCIKTQQQPKSMLHFPATNNETHMKVSEEVPEPQRPPKCYGMPGAFQAYKVQEPRLELNPDPQVSTQTLNQRRKSTAPASAKAPVGSTSHKRTKIQLRVSGPTTRPVNGRMWQPDSR